MMHAFRSLRRFRLILLIALLLVATVSCEDATVGVGVYAPVYGGYGWGPGGTWGAGYGGWGGAVYVGGPVYP
jgi:hypothetical protein